LRLAVAFVPQLVREQATQVCLVVDVLRATTTLTSLLERGVYEVGLATDSGAARAAKAAAPDALLLGEEGGLRPPGFDLGNSPREVALLARERVPSRAICCTSNGTGALRAVAGAPTVLLACLRNATAAARRAAELARQGGLDVTIVCSGLAGGRAFARDDALVAGFLVERLAAAADGADPASLDDAATAAGALYRAELGTDLATTGSRWAAALRRTASGRHLEAIGLGEDIDFCAAVDATAVVPAAAADGASVTVVDPRRTAPTADRAFAAREELVGAVAARPRAC
jgi:2-phosphosulfolactate phosphatase